MRTFEIEKETPRDKLMRKFKVFKYFIDVNSMQNSNDGMNN